MPTLFDLCTSCRPRYRWLLWLLVWPLAAGSLPEKPLTLRPEPLALEPPTFRVAQVRDERPDRQAVAWLLPAPGTNPATPRPVDLQGGAEAALQQFAAQSLPVRAGARPMRMRIKTLRVTEKAVPGGRVEGEVQVQLAFDWLRPDAAPLLLTEYRSGARYGRLAADAAVVEPALRQVLAGGLRYLNNWLVRAAEQDVRLATRVQPTFRYDQRQTEPDTLFYDPARPLAWSDFTGPPRAGNFAAAVFPGFSYQGHPRLRNGVIELDITLQIFVVRSSSWVGPGKNAYYLAHEQRHFDLVKIVAERFRRHATADSLTVEDYNSILQRQYLRSFMEMNRVQEQYDAETRHGLDAAAQQRWDQQIEADLRRFGER